ncbi:MAG: phosphoribosyl-ATP diphosphatase [Pseudomonadota bacterium]
MSGSLGHEIDRLASVIAARSEAGDGAQSYTASLLAKGPGHCARKFGEEAVEAVVAASERDASAVTAEAADALYHLLVLLRAVGVAPDAVAAELDKRQGVSGHAEKAARSASKED